MTPTEPLSSLVKASEVANSIASGLSQNVPFLLSSLATAIFLSLAPESLMPPCISSLRAMFVALSIFLIAYFALLWWFARRPLRQAKWQLKHIGKDEMKVLQGYLKQNKAVGYFSAFDGPVCSLIGKGILRHASSVFPPSRAPVAISAHVMNYLRKHPAIVELKPEEVGSQEPSDGTLPVRTLKT